MSAKRLAVISAMLATGGWFAAGDAVDTNAAASAPPAAGRPWRNSLGMDFVPVPGTNVLFSKWETRVQDYAAFVRREGRKWPNPKFEQGPTHPAVNVTWDDAKAFCQWLTEREQKVGFLPAGCRYRMPKDLEWSAAVGLGIETGKTPFARSGEIKGVYPWDGPFPPPPGAGNYAPVRATGRCAEGHGSTRLHGLWLRRPVRRLPTILTTSGLVSGWCWNCRRDRKREREKCSVFSIQCSVFVTAQVVRVG